MSTDAFTIRSADEIVSAKPMPQHVWAGTIPLRQQGGSGIIAAPPGMGKSRIVLQLAAHQVTGRPFCGIKMDPTPARTLILQSENALPRVQRDLASFASRLTKKERQRLNEYLFITSLEKDLDGDISLSGEEDVRQLSRIADAVQRVQPEVVVVDPWAGCCIDELSSIAIRSTYTALRKACAASEAGPVTIVLVCHAKVGVAAARRSATCAATRTSLV